MKRTRKKGEGFFKIDIFKVTFPLFFLKKKKKKPMEPEQLEDIEEGKIIYDWSPPTGQKQDFFYKGSSITRDQVKKKKVMCIQ